MTNKPPKSLAQMYWFEKGKRSGIASYDIACENEKLNSDILVLKKEVAALSGKLKRVDGLAKFARALFKFGQHDCCYHNWDD